jgi:hypothetical protein
MTDITPIPVLSAEEWDARMNMPMTEVWRRQSAAFTERMKSPEFAREWAEARAKATTFLPYVAADALLFSDADEIGFGKYP